MNEEDYTDTRFEASCLVKYVDYGKYKETIIKTNVSYKWQVEKAELTELQQAQVVILAYKEFIDEYMLDEDTSITDVVSVEFITVTDFIEEAFNREEEDE
jgi:hypothetical protein